MNSGVFTSLDEFVRCMGMLINAAESVVLCKSRDSLAGMLQLDGWKSPAISVPLDTFEEKVAEAMSRYNVFTSGAWSDEAIMAGKNHPLDDAPEDGRDHRGEMMFSMPVSVDGIDYVFTFWTEKMSCSMQETLQLALQQGSLLRFENQQQETMYRDTETGEELYFDEIEHVCLRIKCLFQQRIR